MVKHWMLGTLLLTLAGCQSGPDKPLTPLPDKVTALPYGRLLERSRLQATQAIEASYIQNWTGLIEVATGLEETARFLAKAEDVPAKHKDTLATISNDLGKLAVSLKQAAEAKNVKKTDAILASIHVKVREMSPGDGK